MTFILISSKSYLTTIQSQLYSYLHSRYSTDVTAIRTVNNFVFVFSSPIAYRLFSSAACCASSNFCWAVPDRSSDFSRSSSICWTFLLREATSASVEVSCFSRSSRSLFACSSLFLLTMLSSSTWASFFWSSRTSSLTWVTRESNIYRIFINMQQPLQNFEKLCSTWCQSFIQQVQLCKDLTHRLLVKVTAVGVFWTQDVGM